MTKAYVSVGSNIDPAENVRKALILLARTVHVTGISTVYATAPIGRPEQDRYYNCVVEIETDTPPAQLKFEVLRPIEDRLGRRRIHDPYASRTMDLDLILYNDLAGKFDDLNLPDPQIFERPFLAACLSELAPGLVIPGTGLTSAQVSEGMGTQGLAPLEEYSESLKKEAGHGAGHT